MKMFFFSGLRWPIVVSSSGVCVRARACARARVCVCIYTVLPPTFQQYVWLYEKKCSIYKVKPLNNIEFMRLTWIYTIAFDFQSCLWSHDDDGLCCHLWVHFVTKRISFYQTAASTTSIPLTQSIWPGPVSLVPRRMAGLLPEPTTASHRRGASSTSMGAWEALVIGWWEWGDCMWTWQGNSTWIQIKIMIIFQFAVIKF